VGVREAASKGIKEAIDWLAAGWPAAPPPGPPAYVEMPPWQPHVEFRRLKSQLTGKSWKQTNSRVVR
jgi:hypothetical protein